MIPRRYSPRHGGLYRARLTSPPGALAPRGAHGRAPRTRRRCTPYPARRSGAPLPRGLCRRRNRCSAAERRTQSTAGRCVADRLPWSSLALFPRLTASKVPSATSYRAAQGGDGERSSLYHHVQRHISGITHRFVSLFTFSVSRCRSKLLVASALEALSSRVYEGDRQSPGSSRSLPQSSGMGHGVTPSLVSGAVLPMRGARP